MRRLIAILLVALALSPGWLWRTTPAAIQGPQPLTLTPLTLPAAGVPVGPRVTLVAGWHLRSRSDGFGSYSALLRLPGGDLLALSDRGRFLRFAPPGKAPATFAMGAIGGADDADKRLFDIESATRDPATGKIWLGYEGRNAIRRFDHGFDRFAEADPPEMAGWPSNRGPEAMVRLADGRFIVLSEALGGWERKFSEGLLFPADPATGAKPAIFRFVPPAGFRPTDAAQLPDGRVVVLLRRLRIGLPFRLTSRLVIADPSKIGAGQEWRWRPLAEIAAPLPTENYEGLAIEPRADGVLRLWLIADDNNAALQRTLLLALDWTPETKKARQTARPSSPR